MVDLTPAAYCYYYHYYYDTHQPASQTHTHTADLLALKPTHCTNTTTIDKASQVHLSCSHDEAIKNSVLRRHPTTRGGGGVNSGEMDKHNINFVLLET